MTTPKRLGRPPLPPEQQHGERLHIRLSAALLAKLERLAAPHTPSEWVRERIKRTRETQPEER